MSKTRRLAFVSLLGALSFVLMFFSFPLIPGADFLKVELSVLPVLVGLLLFDLKNAYLILILRTVLKLFLNNRGVNDFIGLPMNIVALGIFVLAFAFLWKKEQTPIRFSLAALGGTFGLTAVMLLLNYFYAVPLYAKFAGFDINQFIGLGKYLIGMVLPFNLVQGVIFSLAFAFTYLSFKPLLKKYQL